jgi:putative (di)nucleoside polyphosphate hydrolase
MTLSTSLAEVRAPRLPMRPCAGIALFNAEGRVFVGRRQPKWARLRQPYVDGPIWQLPQGGIDKGERPHEAAVRELWEETGITSATLVAEIPGWLSYELPRDLVGIALKGRFGGQRLRWFAMRFDGKEREIDLDSNGRQKPEFDAWRWADLDELPELAVSFKRPIYETVAAEFAPFARGGDLQIAAE